jgi:hypothetical protein
MLQEWTDPPPMSATAAAPATRYTDGTLWLAYRIARDPSHSAVVRFGGVEDHRWGRPPAVHVLEAPGDLPRGSFYEIVAAEGVEAAGGRRWVVTFPEAVLDVHAARADVVLRAAAAPDPSHTLSALLA